MHVQLIAETNNPLHCLDSQAFASIPSFLLATRYGAQAAFSLVVTLVCMLGWTRLHSRARNDEEQPLLESSIQTATQPHHGAVGLAFSALAILFGGCIASLCGLGGAKLHLSAALHHASENMNCHMLLLADYGMYSFGPWSSLPCNWPSLEVLLRHMIFPAMMLFKSSMIIDYFEDLD